MFQDSVHLKSWKSPGKKGLIIWQVGLWLLLAGLAGWLLWLTVTGEPLAEARLPAGIAAVGLSLLVFLLYMFRRRQWKAGPGRLEFWLWMHGALGLLLLPLLWLHAQAFFWNLRQVRNWDFLIGVHLGRIALLLILLTLLAGFGVRLSDRLLSRRIAREARRNKIGLLPAIEKRLQEISLSIERFCAGKAEAFVEYCWYAMTENRQQAEPELTELEAPDFEQVKQLLHERKRLLNSQKRLKKTMSALRIWRTIHLLLAFSSMGVLIYHSIRETIILLTP